MHPLIFMPIIINIAIVIAIGSKIGSIAIFFH